MAGKQEATGSLKKGSGKKRKAVVSLSAKKNEKKVSVVDISLRTGKTAKTVAKTAAPVKTAKQPIPSPAKSQKKQKPVQAAPARNATARAQAVKPKAEAKSSTGLAKAITVERTTPAEPSPHPAFVPPSAAALKAFRRASEQQRNLARKVRTTGQKGDFLAKPPVRGKKYTLDLRIHSPGSAGYFSSGGVDPGPALVRLSKVKGIDLISVTDYYNAEFIDIVREASKGSPVTFIPGVDLCCVIGACREVYITALFPDAYGTSEISSVLDELEVPAGARGKKDWCLDRPFRQVLTILERHGAIVIPSRLDKTPYRQLAIPALVEEFGVRAFDLVHPENTDFFRERWPGGGFTFFSFSNANALAQIGTRVAKVKLTTPDFSGIREVVARRPIE